MWNLAVLNSLKGTRFQLTLEIFSNLEVYTKTILHLWLDITATLGLDTLLLINQICQANEKIILSLDVEDSTVFSTEMSQQPQTDIAQTLPRQLFLCREEQHLRSTDPINAHCTSASYRPLSVPTFSCYCSPFIQFQCIRRHSDLSPEHHEPGPPTWPQHTTNNSGGALPRHPPSSAG